MTKDLTPKKPEWFELIDSAAPSAQVRKINRVLPAMAVLVSGAVIATGAFFANASESEDNQSQVPGTSINQIDNSAAAGDPSEATSPAVTSQPTRSNVATSNTSSAAPSSPAVQNPTQGGVMVPGNGGDDDDEYGDDDDDEYGDDDDDGHEGRERHKEREH